jgi:multiple sugar transport system substrate-binding protein
MHEFKNWAKKLGVLSVSLILASSVFAKTTIEFIQWWEPELPKGSFRAIMDDFEKLNPDIEVKLISGPYPNIKDQIIVGAASGTLSDVVGLDGAWVNDLAKQGAITDMGPLMNAGSLDSKEIAAIIKLDGGSYMFPVASFIYPIFVNLDMMNEAGLTGMPKTRAEFFEAAKKLTNKSKNQYGWVLPLSLETPWGVQNDVMSWVWASGGSMMKDGKPNLQNQNVINALKFVNDMHNAGVISPGSLSKKEQDKVEEFVNGRVGMMVGTLAHINMIRKRNPKLNFTITDMPVVNGFKGKSGIMYAAWGIGVSDHSKNKKEAWKLVEYLMSAEVNSRLVSIANAFPGNVNGQPDFVTTDRRFEKAFNMFKNGYLANEFTGLPVAGELMRMLDEEMQLMLQGEQTPEETARKAQTRWIAEF